MSEKDQTITQGLGLNEDFFEEAQGIVKENLDKYDTISDALAATAAEVRDGELGEVDMKITAYERKLVLAGFVMGCVRTSAEAQQKFMLIKMMEDMKGMIGKKSIPKELVQMMLADPDLPEEIRDILREITGDDE